MKRIAHTLRRLVAWEVRMLIGLTANYRGRFAFLVILGLAASFIETLGVSLFVFLLYGAILGAGFPSTGILATLYQVTTRVIGGSLPRMCLIVGLTVLVQQAIAASYEVIGSQVCNRIHHDVRTRLFTQYLSVTYEYIAARNYGELTNTLQVEAWRVAQAIERLSRILITASAVLVYMVVLFFISWPVAVAIAGGGAIVTALTQVFRSRIRKLSRQATGLHEQLAERMFTSIQAMRTIRSRGLESAEISRFTALSLAVERVFVRLAMVENACRPFLEIAGLGALGFMVWVSVLVGNSATTTVALVALLFRLQPQVREMQGHILALIGAQASLATVVRELDSSDKPYPVPGLCRTFTFEKELAFRDVVFVHAGNDHPSLDAVSFIIPCGMTAALVGPSGAGKSTVVNLILKLYEAQQGSITVDGIALSGIDRASWLKRVAIAGQDIDLLEGSILDNIRMAHPLASVADARAALKTANVLDFVETLPQGLNTRAGERGLRLSGGQRQRISLASAIIGKPDILILDEATNAVEVDLESDIHAALRVAFPNLTIIIIAHRKSALAEADIVIALDCGKVLNVEAPKMLAGRRDRTINSLL